MLDEIKWIFFDIGSTLVNEHMVYEHIFQDIAELTNKKYEDIYNEAVDIYKQNKKGDLELGIKYNLPKRRWHTEDEILYEDAENVLKILIQKYKIGVIANQSFGTKDRLKNFGILKYIDLVIASAEEGIAKPDLKIFEIALQRAKCNPNEAVMIGDRIDNDIVPAKKIGMHTIWIKQGFGAYWTITTEEEQAEFVADNISKVCDFFIS